MKWQFGKLRFMKEMNRRSEIVILAPVVKTFGVKSCQCVNQSFQQCLSVGVQHSGIGWIRTKAQFMRSNTLWVLIETMIQRIKTVFEVIACVFIGSKKVSERQQPIGPTFQNLFALRRSQAHRGQRSIRSCSSTIRPAHIHNDQLQMSDDYWRAFINRTNSQSWHWHRTQSWRFTISQWLFSSKYKCVLCYSLQYEGKFFDCEIENQSCIAYRVGVIFITTSSILRFFSSPNEHCQLWEKEFAGCASWHTGKNPRCQATNQDLRIFQELSSFPWRNRHLS
jgi:hypothetical protein